MSDASDLQLLSDEALSAAILLLCEQAEQLDETIAALRGEVARREGQVR